MSRTGRGHAVARRNRMPVSIWPRISAVAERQARSGAGVARQFAWHAQYGAALLEHTPDCHLLFASSSEIYGGLSEGPPLDETAVLAPMNSYAATKAAADLALGAMANDGLRVSGCACSTIRGLASPTHSWCRPSRDRSPGSRRGNRNRPLRVGGGVDSKRDFLDVRDVCRAYVACFCGAARICRRDRS